MDKNRFKKLSILTQEEINRKKLEEEDIEKARLLREEKKRLKALEAERVRLEKRDIIRRKNEQEEIKIKHVLDFDYFPKPQGVIATIVETKVTTDALSYDYKSYVPKIKLARLDPNPVAVVAVEEFAYVDEHKKYAENTCYYYIQAIRDLIKYINRLIAQINDLTEKGQSWMLAYPDQTFTKLKMEPVKESDWLLDLPPPPMTAKTQTDILNASYHTNIYNHTIQQPVAEKPQVNSCLFYDKYELYKRDIDIAPQKGSIVPIKKIWLFDYSNSENFNMGLYMYLQQYQCLFAYYTDIQDRLAHVVLMKEVGVFYYQSTLKYLADSSGEPFDPLDPFEDAKLRDGIVVKAEGLVEGIRLCLSHMPNVPKDKLDRLRQKQSKSP